jgi:hypothetical protein
LASYRNLHLWAAEQAKLDDFIVLPDRAPATFNVRTLEPTARQLLDDTYDDGASGRAFMISAATSLDQLDEGVGTALTWPMYQARALQYSMTHKLPLVSDDPSVVPPFPQHSDPEGLARGLAQQTAIEAVALALPQFLSVELDRVAQFRDESKGMAQPFRIEMLKFTAELTSAIASGATDEELRKACQAIAQTRVAPALADLSRQLKDPIKPFHKIAIDISEAAAATASSIASPVLTVAWAVIRGSKIASDYFQLYSDRQGKRKSGLGFLLRLAKEGELDPRAISEWDKNDWRCSGFVDVLDPTGRLTPENAEMVNGLPEGVGYRTVRRLFQDKMSKAVIHVGPNDVLDRFSHRNS